MSFIETRHIIDCDAEPFIPEDSTLVAHTKVGQIEWDPTKVILYLDKAHQNRRSIEGEKLLTKPLPSTATRVLNANVLDCLLANPYLIPEEWKEKQIGFPGTEYSDTVGGRYVRCLGWDGRDWYWCRLWLDDDSDDGDPTAQ